MDAATYLRRSFWLPILLPPALLGAGAIAQQIGRLLADGATGGAPVAQGTLGDFLADAGRFLLVALLVGAIPYGVFLYRNWGEILWGREDEVCALTLAAPVEMARVGLWFYAPLGLLLWPGFGLLLYVPLLILTLLVGYAYVGVVHAGLVVTRAFGWLE